MGRPSGGVIEAAVGQRHRAAAEHRGQRILGRGVVEHRVDALDPDVGEARRREGAGERVLRAELEEHRADVRRDAGIGDREDLGPAAGAPRTPDRHGRPAAGPKHPAHLASARTGSGTYISPRPHRAASKLPSRTAAPRRRRARTARGPGPAQRPREPQPRPSRRRCPCRRPRPPHRPSAATRKCDQPGAAGDVEHALARPQACHVEHQLMGRRELGLPGVLVGRRRPIPAIALDAALQAEGPWRSGLLAIEADGTAKWRRAAEDVEIGAVALDQVEQPVELGRGGRAVDRDQVADLACSRARSRQYPARRGRRSRPGPRPRPRRWRRPAARPSWRRRWRGSWPAPRGRARRASAPSRRRPPWPACRRRDARHRPRSRNAARRPPEPWCVPVRNPRDGFSASIWTLRSAICRMVA